MLLLFPASPPNRLVASQKDRSHEPYFFCKELHKSGTDHSVYDIRYCWWQFSIWISEVSPFQISLFPGGLMGDHQDERLLGLRHEATVLGGVLRETRHVGKSWFLLLGWTSFWQYYKVIDWSVGKFRWWRKKVSQDLLIPTIYLHTHHTWKDASTL